MNEPEATRLLERLAETFPDQPAPLTGLVTAARQGQRRKARTTLTLGVASVALVLGVGAVVQQLVAGNSYKPSETLTTNVPTAPDGTRFVGMGRVVLAVPDSWATQATECGRPTRDTVFFLDRAPLCGGADQGGVASVLILDASSETARPAVDLARTDDSINGLDVKRGKAECPPNADCDYPFEEVVWVPAHDVVFAVPPGGDDSGVLDSLQLLPEGFTTVPYLPGDLTNGPAGNLLIGAGLKVEQAPQTGMPTGRAQQFGTLPDAGSVVAVGSTVTMLLEPAPSPTCAEGSSPKDEASLPRGPDYPTNAAELTYGATGDDGQEPDLVAVVGECGLTGYVYREQLDEPDPWSPEAGLDPTVPRTLPVFMSDGETQIDTFTLGGASPAPDPPSGPGARVLQGDWSVVIAGVQYEDGTQGYDTFRDTAMTVSVDGNVMRAFDGCQAWTSVFRLVDGEFSLTQPFTEAPQPAAGCDRQAPLVDILGNIRHVSGSGAKVHLHLASFKIVLVLSST